MKYNTIVLKRGGNAVTLIEPIDSLNSHFLCLVNTGNLGILASSNLFN